MQGQIQGATICRRACPLDYQQLLKSKSWSDAKCLSGEQNIVPLIFQEPINAFGKTVELNLEALLAGLELNLATEEFGVITQANSLIKSSTDAIVADIVLIGSKRGTKEQLLEQVPLFEIDSTPVQFFLKDQRSLADERGYVSYFSHQKTKLDFSKQSKMKVGLYEYKKFFKSHSRYSPTDNIKVGQVTAEW